VSGRQVSINAVDVEGNNGAGIQLNGTSRVVSVGNKVRSNPTAISIATGADHFTVVGNTCLVLLRHKFLRKFGGKLRAHAGHRGSRAWPIA
jgi:hypothetical protein